jgi:hypothetical protein
VAANPVAVPAAVWFFGSGLLSPTGLARRRKQADFNLEAIKAAAFLTLYSENNNGKYKHVSDA